jgi:hypothetical protein
MWTLQELVMANEPLVVCGTKKVRWNDLVVGIISWGNIPENRRNPAFIDTLNSAVTARSFWIDRYQKYLDTVGGDSRAWIQGDGRKALAWHQLLDILESRNMLFGKAQDGLMIAIIAVRFLLGQRPLNSVFLLFVVLTRIITMLITHNTQLQPLELGSHGKSTFDSSLQA